MARAYANGGLKDIGEILRGLLAGRCATFHEALEVLRRVLAAEVHAALRHALVATELGVLTDLPVRVREVEERRLVRERLRRLVVPLEARIDRRELCESALCVLDHARICRGRERGLGLHRIGDRATRVEDQDAGRAGLGAADVPRALIAGVRVRRAIRLAGPRARTEPATIRELEM